MKYTSTHAHLYRNKKVRTFEELGVGDCFTEVDDSKFFMKLTATLAVRLETGDYHRFQDFTKCVVAKDVRIDAKF